MSARLNLKYNLILKLSTPPPPKKWAFAKVTERRELLEQEVLIL